MIFEHNPRNPLTMRVVNRCEFDRDAILLKNEEAEGLLSQANFTDIGSRHILTVPSFNKATRVVDQLFGGLRSARNIIHLAECLRLPMSSMPFGRPQP